MKVTRIFLLCLSFILLPTIYTQHCYRRCSCLKNRIQFNKCTEKPMSDLILHFNTKNITIHCEKSKLNNARDIQSFDAKYLSVIDDKSSLTLEEMIRKCYKTKEKRIRYAIDLSRLKNISTKNIILENKDSIKYLQIQGTAEINNHINISIVGPQFGSHLETLIVNNITEPDLKDYFRNIPNIETLDLASNGIEDLSDVKFENLTKLKKIILRDNKIPYLNPALFDGLINITWLDLSHNGINLMENYTFDNLAELRHLNLSSNNLEEIEYYTFASLSKLELLDLAHNRNLSLQENLFQNMSYLVTLNLSDCNIWQIKEMLLQGCKNLQILNISKNEITSLENNTFVNLSTLIVLDLSYNKLGTLAKGLFHPLKKLQHLYLGSNKITVFNAEMFLNNNNLKTIDPSYYLVNNISNPLGKFGVLSIDLNNNRLTRFPEFLVHFTTRLDLSFNRIPYIQLVTNFIESNVEINVSNNIIEHVNITRQDNSPGAKLANKKWKIILNLHQNYLECNCKTFTLLKVSKNQKNTMIELIDEGAFCLNEKKNRQCPLVHIQNCPQTCFCYFTKMDTAINIDCSFKNLSKFPQINNLTTVHHLYKHNQTKVILKGNKLDGYRQERMKRYDNVTSLDLSFNQIHQIHWIPKNLVELHLENNQLTTLSKGVIEVLGSSNFKRLTLEENPWECDCNAIDLRKYLINYNNIKVNESTVICSSSGEPLVHAKICEQSPNILKVALPVGLTAFVAIISAFLALYFKYSTSIKIYLYSKNLCLWFVAEEEIDKEKTYDIFISYSHKDETFVHDEVLTVLENSQPPFKICIHHRDWMPGEFISKQIINSVLDSRRTLVILSNNFMESVWGKMEFRTAHTQAISEGLARVIVVIYGDLDEDSLDNEMKAYLKTNTYVKWGDPWFWNKLKYALPHSKSRNKKLEHQSMESFHIK